MQNGDLALLTFFLGKAMTPFCILFLAKPSNHFEYLGLDNVKKY